MIENGMIKINTVAQTIRPYEIYKLVSSNDPILKHVCKPFDFSDPPENPVHLASSMFETMFENKGLGLSAPQIGKPYRVFVIGYDNSNKQVFFHLFLSPLVIFILSLRSFSLAIINVVLPTLSIKQIPFK